MAERPIGVWVREFKFACIQGESGGLHLSMIFELKKILEFCLRKSRGGICSLSLLVSAGSEVLFWTPIEVVKYFYWTLNFVCKTQQLSFIAANNIFARGVPILLHSIQYILLKNIGSFV